MKLFLTLIGLSVFTSTSFADSWFFNKELVEESFMFGETKVIRVIDTRDNSKYPSFRLKVYYKGVEEANFKNLTFDALTPFDNGNYLLGVSNSGLSTFAYFILTSTGKLVTTVNHNESMHYCHKSVTLGREWVSKNSLKPIETYKTIENEFDKNDPYIFLESVTVKGCDDKDIEVWDN